MATRWSNTRRAAAFAAALLPLAVSAEPFALRLGSAERDIARYADDGFNCFCSVDFNKLPLYTNTPYASAVAADPDVSKIVAATRRDLAETVRRARPLRLALCLSTDEPKFPAPVWKRLLAEAPSPADPKRADLSSEAFWAAYRAKYRETLRLAPPEAKLFMVRTGENYSHLSAGYLGQTVRRGNAFDDAAIRDMTRLINETRRLVVDEGRRTLIWRTWDLGNDGFHANPAVYDRILAGVTNRAGLILSVKYVQTDFWMYNDPNPCIGRGGWPQVIEFQTCREYEGKGAFPNYLGAEYAAAIRSALAKKAVGIWVWGGQGGGWGGPSVKNDLWRRLNVYATMALARHPERTPESVAAEWAAGQFGTNAAPAVSAILMQTRDCVRKMRYIEAYAQRHRGWLPTRNLMRDDIIRGDKVLGDQGGLRLIYNEIAPSLPDVLQEKRDAADLAYSLRESFERLRAPIVAERGQKAYDEALTGFIYLQKLTQVMCHYIRGMFLYYKWQDGKAPELAEAARFELAAWQDSWADYQKSVPLLPAAPTLYRSQCSQEPSSAPGAMADTCLRALADLSPQAK